MRRSLSVLIVVSGLAAIGCGRKGRESASVTAPAPAAKAPAEKRQEVVLLTGFEPFGRRTVNSSWEGVKAWDGKTVAGLKVVALRLPVVWQKAADMVDRAVADHRPVAVACFGQGHIGHCKVEKVGRNVRRGDVRDNERKLTPSPEVVAGAPAEYLSPEPAGEIVAAIRAAGIDAAASSDAGRYICNEVLYRLERLRRTGPNPPVAAVFVHLPPEGTRLASGPTFDRAAAARSVEAVAAFLAGRVRTVRAAGAAANR